MVFSKEQPVLRTSLRIQERTQARLAYEARLAHEAASSKESQSDAVEAETGNSSALIADTSSNREKGRKQRSTNTSSKSAAKRKERKSPGNKKRKYTKANKATMEPSDEPESSDDSSDFDSSVKEESDVEYGVPVSRKRRRTSCVPKTRATKEKAFDLWTRTLSEDVDQDSSTTSSQGESPSPEVDTMMPRSDGPTWTLEQWIQFTLSGMIHAFMAGREHYNSPLATVIYWMPRVAPIDNAASLMSTDPMRFWTIPVRSIDQPWESASVTLHLRTDQVAHWLHISMQDLVGFLTLCSVREMSALNLYLDFRLKLMSVMNAMPNCYSWIFAKTVPQPGEYTYELLLKLRSVDDEQQRLLTVALHGSIEMRRNLFDLAAHPRNAPVAFETKTHSAIFDYHHKAWSLYRTVTSPLLEWRADAVYPGFDDQRSVLRWFRVEDPSLDTLTIDQVRDVIEADMRFRAIVEKDRNDYMAGNLLQDELHCSRHDMRKFFPHQLPFEYQDGGSLRYDSSIDEYVSTQIRVRPQIRPESWWQDELQDIQQQDQAHEAQETFQMELNFQSMQGSFENDRQEQEEEEEEEDREQEGEQETETEQHEENKMESDEENE